MPHHPVLSQRERPRPQVTEHRLITFFIHLPYFGEELVVPVQPQLELLSVESGDVPRRSCRGGEGEDGPAFVLVEREELEAAKLQGCINIVVGRAWAVRSGQ